MPSISDLAIQLLCDLVNIPSITPEDKGCQQKIAAELASLGFEIESFAYPPVDNLWATHGQGAPLFLFLGHTDVVAPGNLTQWTHPPFEATRDDHFIYGRGVADMKGSIAAMVAASRAFLSLKPNHRGTLAFLLTSDEEGPAVDGTARVISALQARGTPLTWCLVGEPSCEKTLGDTIKIGRRGSLTGHLTLVGKQGHIAYPHLADNPIHKSLRALLALTQRTWDTGDAYFPPTSYQISYIQAGKEECTNIIPSHLEVGFNFRYSPALSEQTLMATVVSILEEHPLEYRLRWVHSAKPFLTSSGPLLKAAEDAVYTVTQKKPKLSTHGGTSDGRFIAPLGVEVIEFGPVNQTIHQVNERVSWREIIELMEIYRNILLTLL